MPPAADLAVRDGLRLFSPVAALVRVAESFFCRNPIETQVVLGSLADASDLLRLLAERRPLRESGLSRRRVPADRPARSWRTKSSAR